MRKYNQIWNPSAQENKIDLTQEEDIKKATPWISNFLKKNVVLREKMKSPARIL